MEYHYHGIRYGRYRCNALEAHDENLEVHELGHGFQSKGADLPAVLVHEGRVFFKLMASIPQNDWSVHQTIRYG